MSLRLNYNLLFFDNIFVPKLPKYHIQGRPSGQKSTSATSGNQGFLLRGTQNMLLLSGQGKKTTSAMAWWHWLDGRP